MIHPKVMWFDRCQYMLMMANAAYFLEEFVKECDPAIYLPVVEISWDSEKGESNEGMWKLKLDKGSVE